LYLSLLGDARFAHALLEIDVQMAARTRERGCPRCGGPLHRADYRRKPRGGPCHSGPDATLRHGLCCGREGCRRRQPPPSVRFLGRRVYLGVVVVLGAALQHGLSARRVSRLSSELGVDRRTLSRWRSWWLVSYPRSEHFERQRGQLPPGLALPHLPLSLLQVFGGDEAQQMTALLQWLATPG